ncbi:hypothetical protein BG015_004103 [Linnemannia schmuckeri]|uniref:AB hydrolase-1 domain-containing protein n=1 Tax=Linnemannia schmuckeri TaxID=64567 RepID=A0A9P5S1Z8_9FUNG|nr:hypothetical protein BG015_004103 [Linnemannia schmuckeri]
MRSEKVILLRHLVALLAVSSTTPWIQSVQGLKFSPIKEITLGTEVTIDWTGQPSLGNVEQSIVLMKDGNALLTLCQGQITGSGQCSFELKEEHQVLGDGYQLAMQGMDGVALDYSPEFSIKVGDARVESSSGDGDEKEEKEDEDEDEVKVDVAEENDDGEDGNNDKEEQGDEDEDDENAEKEINVHDGEDDDDGHDDEDNEEDNNNADNDDVEDNGAAKEKKDKKKKQGHQNNGIHGQQPKDKKEQQDHHQKQQQQNKKQPKQHKQKEQRQQRKDGYYKQQVDKLVKTFQQHQKEQHQHRLTAMSTDSREQRAKDAARLLEKNHRRRQMLLIAKRHQYLRMRQQALGLQASISSIFDKLALPMAQAAKTPKAQVVVSASNDVDESYKDDNNMRIGIQPILGNDAYVELMPEHPIQKLATGVVAGGADEIDMELADEQEHYPDKEEEEDNDEKAEQTDNKGMKEAWEEAKEGAESGTWDKVLGGITTLGKKAGTIVAGGLTMAKKIVVGGGADAPGGELFNHKYTVAGGYKYHYVEEGNPTNPAILLTGFPISGTAGAIKSRSLPTRATELSSSTASDTEKHLKSVAGQIRDLLDVLEITEMTLVGHDWGDAVAFRYANWHPDCLKALISVCTPGLPFVDYPVPVDMTVELFPTLRYLLYYTDPDLVPLVSSDELGCLTEQFEKTGFDELLKYYKTGLINYAKSLGENDPVLIPELAVTMPYLYKNYHTPPIQTGHFAMLVKPHEFNGVLEGILNIIHQ